MPKLVDHEHRKAELVAAVWRVVIREGVGAASVRGVAQEAGLSPGSVRYFFADQQELLHFALREVARRVRERIATDAEQRRRLLAEGHPVEAVLHVLRQVLPLTADQVIEARVWFAFVAHEAADATVRSVRSALDWELRELSAHCIRSIADAGALGTGRDRSVEAKLLWALLDGLTLHLLQDPATTSARTAVALLRAHLRALAHPTGN